MESNSKGHWLNIAAALLISYVLGIILFPERFFTFNANLVDFADTPLSYDGAFFVTNGLYHGGVQLWDRYDQMPATFFNLNFSLYKFSNLLTALLYAVLSPFSDHPAQFFHQVASFIFTFSTLCLRVIGVYLLLSMFTCRRWFLIGVTVYGSIVLAPQFMLGLSTNIIYALFPLMMYFLLRYFKELQVKYLLLFALAWAYCIATDFFCGLGYLYQALHFIVVPGVVWALFRHKPKITGFLTASNKISLIKSRFKVGGYAGKIILLGALTLAMVIPSVWLAKAHMKDYEFGIENSRMKDPFSLKAYFKRTAGYAPQEDFLWRSFDYTGGEWQSHWLYLGAFAMFFTILGALVMTGGCRWVLCAALLFFILMNSPRDSGGISGVVHWINALTNPLKFLPRSMHMSFSLLLPFIIMPLCLSGLVWLWEHFKNGRDNQASRIWYLRAAVVVFAVIALGVAGQLPGASKILLLASFVAIALILICAECAGRFKQQSFVAFIAVLVIFFAFDAWAMSRYVRNVLSPVLVAPRPVLARPDLGPVNMDYQNPRTLPVREYYAFLDQGGKDAYLYQQPTNMPGMIFRYTNHWRYVQEISNYLPRHVSFASWVKDPLTMIYYLKSSPRMMFMAQEAVVDQGENFQRVLSRGLQRDVVAIDGYEGKLPDSSGIREASVEHPHPLGHLRVDHSHVSFKKYGDLVVGQFPMPLDMPRYYASTFLTPDEQLFKLSNASEGVVFKIAQGNLVAAHSFDVNNYRDGWVSFAVPANFDKDKLALDFAYPLKDPQGLEDVLINNMDDFKFVYGAAFDGWLVIHQPFDPKWQVFVDGQKVPFYRANKSFIGVPLSKGSHSIFMRYWPNTMVRLSIWAFIFLSTASLFWVLIVAVRERGK